MFQYVLEEAGVTDYELVSVGWRELTSAMREGRLNVGLGMHTYSPAGIRQSGWMQKIVGTVDNLHFLGWPDDIRSALKDGPNIVIDTPDLSHLEGDEYIPDDPLTLVQAYWYLTRSSADRETIHKLTNTII